MRPKPCWSTDARIEPGCSRRRRLDAAFVLSALSLLMPMRPAFAASCDIAAVPAATLLLPYFEVNLDDPNGLTTLFSINNAYAAAVLGHVVVWSDLAVPVLSFDVYLTGYDVQTINLRDVLVQGNLPQTASTGQDPGDTISPRGPFSQDINYASCAGQLPPPALPASYVSHLQNALTGRPSPVLGNLCAGQNLGDHVARGYLTVDTVNRCTIHVPGDPGYFAANNQGEASDQNVLWGTWYIVNSAQNYAQGSDMVAIRADATNPATSTPGRYTFYGRYDGWTAVDHRQPLATTFAAQFLKGGPFKGGTDLLVWRDPKVAQGPFTCFAQFKMRPPWYPLAQEGLVVFDEQENALVSTCPFDCPPGPLFAPFPAATQRVAVAGPSLSVPFNFGWTYLDLNTVVGVAASDPAADPKAAQAWVVFTHSSSGHLAVALDAFRLDSACAPNHFVP